MGWKTKCNFIFVNHRRNKIWGYSSVGFNSKSEYTKDSNAFIFSVDKKKLYNVKKDRDAIYCYS